MKNFVFYILIFIHILSCSNISSTLARLNDPLDKILLLLKERKIEHLEVVLGNKFSIDKKQTTEEIEVRDYNDVIGLALVKVYIQKKQNRIDGIGVFYFLDFDNYQHLKNKFGHLTWIEKKLENKSDHVIEDNRSVHIEEIGLKFNYDEFSPKRKIFWLSFE